MGFAKKIYDNSPIIIQNLLTTIKGYQHKRNRYNKTYYEMLQYYSEIKDPFLEQQNQINKLLIHLKSNVPFYREILRNTPNEYLNFKVLSKLPIIEKENLRNNIEAHINENAKKFIVTKTGGTTGKSLEVFTNREDLAKRIAYLDFFKMQHGVKPFSRRASFTGQEIVPYKQKNNIYWRYNYAIKQMLYSGFHVNEMNIPYYIESLNKFKPLMLDGFPTSIYRIAKYINTHNINLEFTPIGIFPTAETLLDYQKKEIETAFKAPVRNQYASSEGAPFITECINGKLHMNIETGYFNIIKQETEENIYELIVTSFLNYTTPIVQYKIGDLVEYYENQTECPCGNKAPYVSKILGRESDYLISKKHGKITSVNMANAIKQVPKSIITSQFIQRKLDELEVKLVVDEQKFRESDKRILTEAIKYRFGEDVKIEYNLVAEIEKEKNGKTLFIKSLISGFRN